MILGGAPLGTVPLGGRYTPAAAPPSPPPAARGRGPLVLLMARYFLRHQPYAAAPAWIPASLFQGEDRGFWLDFTDPTKMRNAAGAQAAPGEYVRSVTPSAGSYGDFLCSANGPIARPGALEFMGSTGVGAVLRASGPLKPLTGGGIGVAVYATEPSPLLSGGATMTLVDGQFPDCLVYRGPEFISGGGVRFYTFGASGSYASLTHSYAPSAGAWTLRMADADPTTMRHYSDSATAAVSGPSNNQLRDSTGSGIPASVVGASFAGTSGAGGYYYGYVGRQKFCIVRDRPFSQVEREQLLAYALALQ